MNFCIYITLNNKIWIKLKIKAKKFDKLLNDNIFDLDAWEK